MYLYNKVCCVVCQQEYSVKGIHTHYHISHTEEGKQKHKENAVKYNTVGGRVIKEKFQKLYKSNPNYCIQCNNQLPQNKKSNKFCSRSCAAKYNNTVSPKRKKALPLKCNHCGKDTDSSRAKYCSTKCFGLARRLPDDVKRAKNAATQAKYRAKYGYLRAHDPFADTEKIKAIYANCPEGHEVDHIIPLSKGGKHHENNLQYLTVGENRRKSNKIL